jgi:hypothetical protein
VFYNLSESELENIVSKMFYCEAQSESFIFRQTDPATCFFILERGSLEVIVNDKVYLNCINSYILFNIYKLSLYTYTYIYIYELP